MTAMETHDMVFAKDDTQHLIYFEGQMVDMEYQVRFNNIDGYMIDDMKDNIIMVATRIKVVRMFKLNVDILT